MIDEEEITARLLRLAGARPGTPADRASRVRRVVHQQWLSQMRRRRLYRRTITGIALGGVATAAVLIVGGRAIHDSPTTIPRVGSIEQVIDEAGRSPLTPGDPIDLGKWMDTGSARVGLRLNDGTSVRIDTAALIRVLSPSVVELARGGVYLDTGLNSPRFEVRTPIGSAHDIGTQFEVRITDAGLRVRVRTGLVEIRNSGQATSVRPGTEVTLTGSHVLTKPIAAFGRDWEWTHRLAPRFDANGRSLAAFLEHTAREQGWTLRYGDPQLAREASGIILHGTLLGLEPRDAVAVAVRMCGLSHTLEAGDLVVTKPAVQK